MDNNLNLKKLDEAFRLLSLIPVSGDNVDRMALARQGLRDVYNDLKGAKTDA